MHPLVSQLVPTLLPPRTNSLDCLGATLSCVLHMLRDTTSSEGPGAQLPWVVLGEHQLHSAALPEGIVAYYQELATYDPQQLIIKQQQRYHGTCVSEIEISVRACSFEGHHLHTPATRCSPGQVHLAVHAQ